MQSTKRTKLQIGTLTLALLGGLLVASAAEADDRHRGERINDRLDFFAAVAALGGEYELALALDRRGDRIERRLDGDRYRNERGGRTRPSRRHARGFALWGHGAFRHHDRHHGRSHRGCDDGRKHRRSKSRHRH